jgi:uncharacterized protein YbjT (DUF2867 family)
MNNKMKIVVIGGSGLIGAKVVSNLRQRGHEVVAASPSTGVNTLTGEGLAEALAGAQVVVDVANSPSFEDKPALEFFETSGRNLLAAEKAAGVRHHVALSVVGTDRLTGSGPGSLSGYFRAKMAQENLIKASGIPFTIVHATQFFEFVKSIAQSSTGGSTIRLSSVLMQPMASDDVAAAVAEVALGQPVNGMIEVTGPDRIRQDELVRQFLTATGDARKVDTDDNAGYFGIAVNDQSLVPGDNPRLGPTHYNDWLKRSTA